MTPKYVTIHNTSNSAPAKNEISYMRSNSNYTSYHYAVDDKEVIQGVSTDRNAFHCGDGTGVNSGNRTSIGIEICYSTKYTGNEYTQAEENAVYLAARVLYAHKLGIERLKKHQDWSGKYCPHRILEQGQWDSFKSRVGWVLNEINKGTVDPRIESGTTGLKATTTQTTETKKYYRVVAGSFTSYGAAKIKMAEVQDVGYSAFVKQTIVNGTTYYRVYAGSYSLKQNAVNQQTVLKVKGISSFLVYE
jgi:N-acetylmuramoyl-L-alanine amidase CwlA